MPKIFYPVDSPEASTGKPSDEKAAKQPQGGVTAESNVAVTAPASPGGGQDEVLFGSAPKPAQKDDAAPSSAASGGEPASATADKFAIPHPVPGEKFTAPEPVDARRSDVAPNAISRTFNAGADAAWEQTLDAMLLLPILSTDKAGGVIVTDWILDEPSSEQNVVGDAGIFGDAGAKLVKYKYFVKVRGNDSATEITVVPYAQFQRDRMWRSGTPKPVVAETLMKRIIGKMEK